MPHHDWSDKYFDWIGLHTAIHNILRTLRCWGRISTHGKEKFGTFRDQAHPWDGSMFELLRPGHCYVPRWYRWLYNNVDYPIVVRAARYSGFLWLFRKWQATVYNFAVQQQCKRYPHLIDELVVNLDLYEWVKPGIFGAVDGTIIHKKCWKVFGED